MMELDDDADYVDEAHEELDQSTKDGRAKAGGYQLTNVLKLPRATTYSTQALYDQVHAGDIDLEPEYQRDVVWPEAKQIGLVDSIFRNFYVPPVIFVTHQHEDGSETKTCIDGKQRLTSIHRFMDGLIPHRDSNTGVKYWYKIGASSQGSRGQPLPERYRRLFANKQMVCIEYQDLPDSDEREIFQRVQLGMALTPAEKLQVFNTPMSSFIRSLQSEYLKAGSPLDAEGFDWDRSRGGDFRCIAHALYVIAKYPSAVSIGTVMQLEKWLHKPTSRLGLTKGKKKASADNDEDLSQDETYRAKIHDTFRTFGKLASDPSLHVLFLKSEWRVSPIEFIMICLLISVYMNDASLRELAIKIGDMRVQVRKEHVDIRMNPRVAKTMFDFIEQSNLEPPSLSGDSVKSEFGSKRKREDEVGVDVGPGRGKEQRGDGEDWMSVSAERSQPPPPSTPTPGSSSGPAGSTVPPPPKLESVVKRTFPIAPPRVIPSKLQTGSPALK